MNAWSGQSSKRQVRPTISGTPSTRPVITNLAMVQLLCTVAAILATLPIQLVTVLEYPIRPTLLALAIILPLVWHTITEKSSNYLSSPFTGLLWLMRWLAIIIYLLAHLLHTDIQLRATLAFVVTLAFSFFYELGYALVANKMWQAFLRIHVLVFSMLCFILLPIFLYQIIKTGYQAGVYLFGTYQIAPYLKTWPNYFSISAAIVMGLIVYFGQKNKRYFVLLGVVGPMLWLTEGRAGTIALVIIFAVWLWKSRTQNRRFLLGLLIVALVIANGTIIMKPRFAESVGGRTLERSYIWRLGAAQTALETWWQKYPLLGNGFNSFADLQLEFQFGRDRTPIASPHNDYVDLLVRGGLLYSVAFWGWIILVAFAGLRAKFTDERTTASQLLASFIIGLMATAWVQNPFKTPEVLLIFWYCAGVIAGFRGSLRPTQIEMDRSPQKPGQGGSIWLKAL